LGSCGGVAIDHQGDLGLTWSLNGLARATFFTPDSAHATTIVSGPTSSSTTELPVDLTPGSQGFVLDAQAYRPYCAFGHLLDPFGNPISTALIDDSSTRDAWEIDPNPLGGFVEVRKAYHGHDCASTLDLRFVDDALGPLGDWYTAISYTKNIQYVVDVDQQGKALIIAFAYPPSFGIPPPPSEWTYSARWMDANGPVGEVFTPPMPTFTPQSYNGPILFAGTGQILSLPDGGFAFYEYQAPASSGGTITPTGWYAYYPSGQSTAASPPAWLALYDGSLSLLRAGGFAGIEYDDSNSCARTLFIVASSGRRCFSLNLPDTETCTSRFDVISPDGTFVIENGADGSHVCTLRWWPGLAAATSE
jgi:hypothetical protein